MSKLRALHEWAFANAGWRSQRSTKVLEEHGERSWNGWRGDDPPSHVPVFVVTHYPRPRLPMKGGTSFTFGPPVSCPAIIGSKRRWNRLLEPEPIPILQSAVSAAVNAWLPQASLPQRPIRQ